MANDDPHVDPDGIEELLSLPSSDPRARAARRHVKSCAHCLARWQRTERTVDLLDGGFAFDPSPPADLTERGIAIIEAAGAAAPQRAGSWAWWSAAGAALAALLLAWIGLGPTELDQSALKCAAIELATAGAAWLGARTYLHRHRDELVPSTGAGAAAAGALGGSVYLHVACTDHHAAHLFVAHALTVSLAAGLGALAAHRLGSVGRAREPRAPS
jgi:hypothetical protein